MGGYNANEPIIIFCDYILKFFYKKFVSVLEFINTIPQELAVF